MGRFADVRHIRWKIAIPLVLLILGVAIVVLFVLTAPRPAEESEQKVPPAVRVMTVQAGAADVEVHARGRLEAARRVALRPKIAGPVVWVSDALEAGGRFEKGEVLLRIDPRDFRYAVQERRSELREAQVELRRQRNLQRVSEREWRLFGDGTREARDVPFAKRIPQLRAARAAVEAARDRWRQARLNLRRTRLRAPFDASVQSEDVEVGQHIGPQTAIVTLTGTRHYRVRASVEVSKLSALRIPEIRRGGAGAAARVWVETGRGRIRRTGRVLRLLTDLDPAGNMARLLLEVDDPLGLEMERATDEPPLLIGMYVHVAIDAEPLRGVIRIPRTALRPGDKVWTVDADSQLVIRDVELAWRGDEAVWVREGLPDGALIVLDPLPTPIGGMKLEIAEHVAPGTRAEAP